MTKALKTVTPSIDDMVAIILSHHSASTANEVAQGMAWYDVATAEAHALADEFATVLPVVAVIIAAHSQNCRWAENKRRARMQLAGTPVGFGTAKRMSALAMANPANALDYITGPKINPFAHNISGDLTQVATDRWAQRAVFLPHVDWSQLSDGEMTAHDLLCDRLIGRKGVRDMLILGYQKAAAEAGITPAQMQAIVWVHVRGSAD